MIFFDLSISKKVSPYLLVFGLILIFFNTSVAQRKLSTSSKKAQAFFEEADNYRVRGQYRQAIELLNEAIKKDKNFVEAYASLGVIYKVMKMPDQAKGQFEKAIALAPDDKSQQVLYFLAAELYLQVGEYENATKYLKQYLSYQPANKNMVAEAKGMLGNASFAINNIGNVAECNPEPLSPMVNRYPLQYFPVLTVDQKSLIFTRRKGTTSEFDEDLVICSKNNDGEWGAPKSISTAINTINNEGTCTISADGRILIFTSCFGRKGYGSCDLYISYKTGEKWSVPKNLGSKVNSKAWDSQPSLSADGRTLYFVSNRGGGIGRRDLWSTKLDANDEWMSPKNLGPEINTPKDEISPFIHANSQTLYFASDGHPGFGGFDIFHADFELLEWEKPINLGAPINNGEDQLSLFITADGKKGYYSNESVKDPNSRGKLYVFDVPASMQVKHKSNYVRGQVFDADTKQPLKAKVELYDLKNKNLLSLTYSDSISGDYMMVLTEGSEYALYVDKQKYLFQSLSFNLERTETLEPKVLDVFLHPIQEGMKTTLENIFFDVDKYDLKEKSKTEIEKVSRFMSDNPSVSIEIGGHTDNTGNPSYNQSLSLKRAQSVYNYLLQIGVSKNRLEFKGYGQSQPLVPNDSERNKEKNRRIEFTVR